MILITNAMRERIVPKDLGTRDAPIFARLGDYFDDELHSTSFLFSYRAASSSLGGPTEYSSVSDLER